MKIITKMELTPGMVLAEDIVFNNKILYKAGTKVDALLIEKLQRYTILCVSIMEDIDLATTHYEIMHLNENFKAFEKAHGIALYQYKNEIKRFVYTGVKPDDDVLMKIFDDLYSYISSAPVLLDYLYNLMPNEDELTYTHSLNSALLAGALADTIHMKAEERRILILCGFYYDIGKLQLPYEILWKPDKLTREEFALVKKHPLIGYMFVRTKDMDEHVKHSILMHHERMDGSGYPYQLMGDKIDVYARYIGIIDTYIAMASPRSYRGALTPLQILGNFEKCLGQYDPELLMPLMKRVADAQIGTKIQLSDGTVWEVFIIHPNVFSRPILKNEKNEFLDLLERPDLEIVKNI